MNVSQVALILLAPLAILNGCSHSGSSMPGDVTANGLGFSVTCGGKIKSLENILRPIIANMVAQKIPYSQQPPEEWRDCSGNFLRLSSYLATACPEQQKNLIASTGVKDYTSRGNNVVQSQAKARNTRTIAQWYLNQGRFTPIYYDGMNSSDEIRNHLQKYRQQIRPGTVLWFSKNKSTSAKGMDALFTRTNAGIHIGHMGTVSSVIKDKDGQVMGYSLYHGHGNSKAKTPASVTKKHHWKWPAKYLKPDKFYPPFGFWKQYLVGVGSLLPTPESSMH